MTLCEGWAEGWQDVECSETFWGSCIMLFVFKAQVGQAEESGGKMEVMAGTTPPESQTASSSPSFSFWKQPSLLMQNRGKRTSPLGAILAHVHFAVFSLRSLLLSLMY